MDAAKWRVRAKSLLRIKTHHDLAREMAMKAEHANIAESEFRV